MKSTPRYPSTKPNKAALVEPRVTALSSRLAANSEPTPDPESSADADTGIRDATAASGAVAVDTSIGRPGAAPIIDGQRDAPTPAPAPVAPEADPGATIDPGSSPG